MAAGILRARRRPDDDDFLRRDLPQIQTALNKAKCKLQNYFFHFSLCYLHQVNRQRWLSRSIKGSCDSFVPAYGRHPLACSSSPNFRVSEKSKIFSRAGGSLSATRPTMCSSDFLCKASLIVPSSVTPGRTRS